MTRRPAEVDAMSADLLDYRALDLDAAGHITYRLEQSFRYDYAEPVESLRQRLVVVPPDQHGNVYRREYQLDVRGAVSRRQVRRLGGNTVVHVAADRVERRIEFHLTAVLERVTCQPPPLLPLSSLTDVRFLTETRLTRPDAALRAWAAQLRRPGEQTLDTADRLCAAVHQKLTYQFGVTGTRTTAAQALAGGVGVCQDFAHIMLALCHLLEVPARYVSGHLLGQGGTHAWVEVIVASDSGVGRLGAVALAFDPCNGRRAGNRYVTVATGRDYSDVAPTAGTYEGAPTGRLSSSRRLGVVDLAA